MTGDILAFVPGAIEILIILIVLGVPFFMIVLFYRLILRNKRENVRLRLEVGKLADELEQVRKESKKEEEDSSG